MKRELKNRIGSEQIELIILISMKNIMKALLSYSKTIHLIHLKCWALPLTAVMSTGLHQVQKNLLLSSFRIFLRVCQITL